MNYRGVRSKSCFLHGRGRGRAYRPYFYFRRNGRVIPAGSRRNNALETSTSNIPGRKKRSEVGDRSRFAPIVHSTQPPISASFLKPENYVVPEDSVHVQSITIENPSECPGWRLYFLKDDYDSTSELGKRIKAIEAHYQRNVLKYDFMQISVERCFPIEAETICNDVEIKEIWPTLIDELRERPVRTLSILALAMYLVVSAAIIDLNQNQLDSSTDVYIPRDTRAQKMYVRPKNFMQVELITNITKIRVDQLYCVRGVVTAVGDLTYSAAWIAYKCTRCQMEQTLRQNGHYNIRPYYCRNGKCAAKQGFIELRSSPYTRLCPKQFIRLKESNLQQLTDFDDIHSSSLDIELRHDLVDIVTVGMEVVVTGILKMQQLFSNEVSTSAVTLDSKRPCNNNQIFMKAVAVQDAKHIKRNFNTRDLEAISRINAEPDSFNLLVQSLTPEVHGYEMAKAACLLSLFGGSGSLITDEATINVLLVGDPGIGKSKILQACAQISERGTHISGKPSLRYGNKIGVTFEGRSKHSVQAGTIMMAHTGHCTIDDLDKLTAHHSLILQTMQSQQINLPYPFSFSTLSAQTSVIASINPRGRYDRSRYLLENVRLMPALLKEFHLVFLLLDQPNKDEDASFTEHIRALHAGKKKREHIAKRYATKPKTNDSMTMSFINNEEDVEMAEDQKNYLCKRLLLKHIEGEELDLLPPVLMKKFIAYARQNVKPLLTDGATEDIKKFYFKLQSQTAKADGQSNLSTGQLLSLIHLSQARARIDLSSDVTKAHVRDVIEIVTESMAQTSLGSADDDVNDLNGIADCGPNSTTTTAMIGASSTRQFKHFLIVMQQRARAVGRTLFDFDELKEMARRAGILCGVRNLVDTANMQGYLLKKGTNIYQVLCD